MLFFLAAFAARQYGAKRKQKKERSCGGAGPKHIIDYHSRKSWRRSTSFPRLSAFLLNMAGVNYGVRRLYPGLCCRVDFSPDSTTVRTQTFWLSLRGFGAGPFSHPKAARKEKKSLFCAVWPDPDTPGNRSDIPGPEPFGSP
jgi:hypothetical protein